MTYIGREDANFNPDIGRECLKIVVKALVLPGFRWAIFRPPFCKKIGFKMWQNASTLNVGSFGTEKLTCMADGLF